MPSSPAKSTKSVSYTHLDVYKRQSLDSVILYWVTALPPDFVDFSKTSLSDRRQWPVFHIGTDPLLQHYTDSTGKRVALT